MRAAHALTRAAHAYSLALAHACTCTLIMHRHMYMHMYMHMAMLMLTPIPCYTGPASGRHATPSPHPHRRDSRYRRWMAEPRARLYIPSEYSPPIARSPLPRWQVRVASRRASRRASQTRQSLSFPPNPPHPVQPVQHAARVSARLDLPRSPAIYYIYIITAATMLYCLGKQRRSKSRLCQSGLSSL